MSDDTSEGSPRRFLRSGGWVLLAALALTGAVFGYHVASLLGSRTRALGDGKNAASYGFDLSCATVPLQDIVAGGMPKDGLPALVDPATWTLTDSDAKSARPSKFLVPTDRVIGVRLGDQSRAYPLRLLVWHEIVNDTLGGRPIAVTYSALCDSAVVFDRVVAGAPVSFGVSGLLYQSNLLLFDRRPKGEGESLWSQLLFRAVTGPAASAGRHLDVLPSTVSVWADWRTAHPDTTVIAPDPRLQQQYKRDPYSSYFGSDLLRYPVHPLPPPDRGSMKTPLVAVLVAGQWHAFPFPAVDAHADASGSWRTLAGSTPVDLQIRRQHPQTVDVSGEGEEVPTARSFLFAWYATHARDTVWHD